MWTWKENAVDCMDRIRVVPMKLREWTQQLGEMKFSTTPDGSTKKRRRHVAAQPEAPIQLPHPLPPTPQLTSFRVNGLHSFMFIYWIYVQVLRLEIKVIDIQRLKLSIEMSYSALWSSEKSGFSSHRVVAAGESVQWQRAHLEFRNSSMTFHQHVHSSPAVLPLRLWSKHLKLPSYRLEQPSSFRARIGSLWDRMTWIFAFSTTTRAKR